MVRHKNRKPHEDNDSLEEEVEIFRNFLSASGREEAEYSYSELLGSPMHAPLIGCPLIIGGLSTESTVIRARSISTFNANTLGEAWAVIYAHTASPGDTFSGETNEPNAHEPAARIPTVGGAGVNANQCLMAASSGTVSTSTTPGPGSQTPAADNDIWVPQTGLNLDAAEARLVAQEIRIRPIGSVLLTQGQGFMARASDYNVGSLAQPYDASFGFDDFQSAYDQQANSVDLHSFTGWDESHVFRSVWLPKTVGGVSFAGCDVDPLIASRQWPTAGHSAFFASGLPAGYPFSLEIVSVYELRSNNYTTSTRQPYTGAGLELIQDVEPTLAPAGMHVADADSMGLQAAAAHQFAVKPPSRAASFLRNVWGGLKRGASGLGSFLMNRETGGKVAGAVLPAILAAGMSRALPMFINKRPSLSTYAGPNPLLSAPRLNLAATGTNWNKSAPEDTTPTTARTEEREPSGAGPTPYPVAMPPVIPPQKITVSDALCPCPRTLNGISHGRIRLDTESGEVYVCVCVEGRN